jgi:hypothetical protein
MLSAASNSKQIKVYFSNMLKQTNMEFRNSQHNFSGSAITKAVSIPWFPKSRA